jgi:hypothetical protein
MDCNGKNWVIDDAVSLFGNTLKLKTPFITPSIIFQTKRNPSAKAERFTNIPKNKQKEKKPTSLIKYAKRYSKLENIIPNSVYEE